MLINLNCFRRNSLRRTKDLIVRYRNLKMRWTNDSLKLGNNKARTLRKFRIRAKSLLGRLNQRIIWGMKYLNRSLLREWLNLNRQSLRRLIAKRTNSNNDNSNSKHKITGSNKNTSSKPSTQKSNLSSQAKSNLLKMWPLKLSKRQQILIQEW